MVTGSTSLWTCATASAMGSSHHRTGAPNQDAVASFITDDGTCVAVADGHGGDRYVRSSDGSRLAVEAARRLGAELLRQPTDLWSAAQQLPARLVSSWIESVSEHLREHPLTPAEAAKVGPEPTVAYGATLIVLLCRRDDVVVVQLGDGDVVAGWLDGRVTSPVPIDPRNVAGVTTSLCLPDAEQSFRIASLAHQLAPPDIVVVATDGYGNSFAEDGWEQRVMVDLLAQLRGGGHADTVAALPAWVGDSAAVGGDDATVAIVFRNSRYRATASAAAPQRAVEAAGPNRKSRLRIAGVPVAIALVVGLFLGWLLGRSSEPPESVPAVTSTIITDPVDSQPTPPSSVTPNSTPITTVADITDTTAPATPPTTAPATAAPPLPVIEPLVDGTIVLAVQNLGGQGRIALVEVDVLGGGVRVIAIPEGGTVPPETAPTLQLFSATGSWRVVDGDLTFARFGSDPRSIDVERPDRASVAAIGFTTGRVVALIIDPSTPDLPPTALLFDASTADPISTTRPATSESPTEETRP